MASNPSLMPEIGPDGLAREAPVIAYTEKVNSLFSIYISSFVQCLTENVMVSFFILFYLFLLCRQIIEEERLQLKKYEHIVTSNCLFFFMWALFHYMFST